MTPLVLLVLVPLAAYFVGAVPFGYLVARWRGIDILHQGSGNIGATNVGRLLGRRFGVLVFLLDFAKGALPVLSASALTSRLGSDLAALPAVLAALAAFLGHLFPVYLRFRGGKGVATGAGIVTVLVPVPALAALLTWVTILASTRYVSLASLLAAALLCGVYLLTTPQPWDEAHLAVTLFCLLAAALVGTRHRANLRRLFHGNENRVKDSPAMLHLSKTLHVLAVGLWFGTVVFFTITGLVLFGAFERLSTEKDRPLWFPLPSAFAKEPPSDKFPNPLSKEQGSRAAGYAVSPLFPWYYGVQTVCALVATATALGWSMQRRGEKVHRLRSAVLVLALLGVAMGWWLEHVVSDLRGPRNDLTDAVLTSPSPTADEIQKAVDARSAFGDWHGYSLLANMATLLLVAVAMALAAQLPEGTPKDGPLHREPKESAEGYPAAVGHA
jgi:acyl-phosphate glycerol 3-phosphate acyltransferase